MKKEVTKKRMSGLPKISTSKILPYQDSKLNVDLDDDNNRPIDLVVTNKESLISLFELMFGTGSHFNK
jgi:hypothetical protein